MDTVSGVLHPARENIHSRKIKNEVIWEAVRFISSKIQICDPIQLGMIYLKSIQGHDSVLRIVKEEGYIFLMEFVFQPVISPKDRLRGSDQRQILFFDYLKAVKT